MRTRMAMWLTCVLISVLGGACEIQRTEEEKTHTLPRESELRTVSASKRTQEISAVRAWKLAHYGTPEADVYGTDEAGSVVLRAKFKSLDDSSILIESMYPERMVIRLLNDGTIAANGSEDMQDILDAMMLDVLGKELPTSRAWYKPWTWWNGCAFETTMTVLFCGPPVAACISILAASDGGGWPACAILIGAAAPFCIPHLANAICACGGSSVSNSCPCSLPFWSNNELYCEKFPECRYDETRSGDNCYKPGPGSAVSPMTTPKCTRYIAASSGTPSCSFDGGRTQATCEGTCFTVSGEQKHCVWLADKYHPTGQCVNP